MAQRERRSTGIPARAFALIAAAALAGGCAPERPAARNLVLISLDTLRADRLGAYGYGRDTSPNLDAFAARSAVFLDAVTQFTTTHYSHQALLTGRFAFRPGIAPSLAQLLQAAGFRTAGFTGGGYLHRSFGFQIGFDEYHDDTGGLEGAVPLALAWLRENRDRRFFLFLHSYDVHCPYTPPEPYARRYLDGAQLRLEYEGRCGANYFNELALTPADVAELSAVYDGGVRWTDALLAPLFAGFERLGLYRDSVIVVTSDHGEALGEHGFVGHGRLSEAELAVPLMLSLPGEAPARVEAPVSLVDVFPTVLARLGVEPTLRLDGVDLTPLLRGEPAQDAERPRLSQSTLGNLALRQGRWKLVTRGRASENALYDLSGDPERDVLAEHPEVAERLMRELAAVIRLEPGSAPFRTGGVPPPAAVAPELREQLRALGYAQ